MPSGVICSFMFHLRAFARDCKKFREACIKKDIQ